MFTSKQTIQIFISLLFIMHALPSLAQVSLGKMTPFWRTAMMTGGSRQENPWHLYENPVKYLDDTDFPYNYAKYGHTANDEFVLHADVASYVRFLSGPGTTDEYDLAKRVNGKVVLQKEALARRFAKTEASGAIKNYIIVLDNIPLCFPTTPEFETYGQVAMPADMDEWETFIIEMCEEIKIVLGEEKANNLSFRLGTEAHNGNRFKYADPAIMLNFYKITAQAVKSVLPGAKFGPYNTHTPWREETQVLKMNDLVTYCKNNSLPLDFIGYTWYVSGATPLTDPTDFNAHWQSAFATNPALDGIPVEYQEFGVLGVNSHVRATSDNAAAMFTMLMESVAGGFTGTYHWPVVAKIASNPDTYLPNGINWLFQMLDYTTGGDAYLFNREGGSNETQEKILGVFNCDNQQSYLMVSLFNQDQTKESLEVVKFQIPKELIKLGIHKSRFKIASLDHDNCPLLAIRKDLEGQGFISQTLLDKPNYTPFSGVHYILQHDAVTSRSQANQYIRTNKQKYIDLSKTSYTLQDKTLSIIETADTYEVYLPLKTNSISVILIQNNLNPVDGLFLSSLEDIKLYPNPVHDVLHVFDESREDLQYCVYNSQGQGVMRGVLKKNTLDVSSLATGYYVLSLSTQRGEKVMRNFVKR